MSERATGAAPPPRPKYVGFWKRFVAFLIDSLAVMIVVVPLLLAAHEAGDWQRLSDSLQDALAKAAAGAQVDVAHLVRAAGFSGPLDVLIQVVLPIAALLAFWKFRNATPGKMVLAAKIVDAGSGKPPSDRQLVVRFLGYFVSVLTLGLGFVWIAIDRRKQGFHDKLAGTVVVYEHD
jgi:uncharacterized RDD family membrane protein YckC